MSSLLQRPRSLSRRPAAAVLLVCAGMSLLAACAAAAPLKAAAAPAAAAPLKAAAAAAAPAAAPPASASSAEKKKKSDPPPPTPPLPTPTPYVICEQQTYALCAAAESFVYQEVAYAKCVIKSGDSISAPPLSYETSEGETEDICDVNAAGVDNGYMMSTFSLPEEVKAGGPKAIYTCPGGSQGGYAQCDGGTCFKSTIGQTFPGVGDLGADEIVCSCPIVMATTATAPFGWQFVGPYPCEAEPFAACDQDPIRTGELIPVGAPPGAGRVLTQLLYGQQYALNECFAKTTP